MSGIESALQALKNLDIKYNHLFSSDIDKFAKKSLLANYTPDVFYDDIYSEKKSCKLDLYMASPPCQSFSSAGNREGTSVPKGLIFNRCIEVIKETDTNTFILENVRGLMTIDKGQTFKSIINQLESLGTYNIYWKLLNTKDYGLPQSRPRIFIVGIKKSVMTKEFTWPEPIEMKSLESIIDYTDTSTSKIPINKPEILEKISRSKSTFIDLGWQNFTSGSYEHYSQCLTACSTMWNLKMNRKANVKELLRLQGFNENFKQVVSYTQMKRQIGNSISVCVLEEIIKEIINVSSIGS